MAAAAALALLTTGCSDEAVGQWGRAGLPDGITNQADRITTLWQGAWVVALLVGLFVWGLILHATVFHRRRRDDTGLPPQVRYNVPIEVLYTAVPIVIVGVYFYFTAVDQEEIWDVAGDAEHHVEVVGKRWSWDFNYIDAEVFETGTPGVPPTLVLPRGEKVEFILTSRDVIHSFWVPAFLFKLDTFPGRINRFEVVAERTGTFAGKCAELCGQDHARMLFTVEVVEPEEYVDYLEELRERGQTGLLPADIGPRNVPPTSSDDDPQSGSTGSDN